MIPCKLDAHPAVHCSILDFTLFESAGFSLHIWCSGHKQPQEGQSLASLTQMRSCFMEESFPEMFIQLKIFAEECWR